MIFITILSFLGAFFLSLFAASTRKLNFTKPAFFYQGFQRLFFQKKETERIYTAVRIIRVLLLITSVALLSTYINNLIYFSPLILVAWLVIDIIPSIIGYRYYEKAFAVSAPIVSLYLILFSPLHFIITAISKSFIDVFAFPLMRQTSTGVTEKVIAILESNEGKTPHDKDLIHAVIAFKDRIVREVMIPRVHLFALPVKTTIKEASLILLREGYSRVPIYKEHIDEVLGILMYKDILKLFVEAKTYETIEGLGLLSLDSLIKPILFTPENKKVAALLQDFRSMQMHMAIVVDEYGGTEGLVTIEDILEEIVGEIADEYDEQEENLYIDEGEGSFLVDPRMSILDIEEHFGIKIQ